MTDVDEDGFGCNSNPFGYSENKRNDILPVGVHLQVVQFVVQYTMPRFDQILRPAVLAHDGVLAFSARATEKLGAVQEPAERWMI